MDLTEIFNLEKNEGVLAGLIRGVVVAIRVLAHVRPQRALPKGTRRLRSTTRLTKGRIDDRASLLDHAQWPQDRDFPGGERASLSHRAGQHQRRRPVQAGVPQDFAEQPHPGDRRPRSGRAGGADQRLRVRRDPALPGREDGEVPAQGPARTDGRAAVALLADGRPWSDGGAEPSFQRLCAREDSLRDRPVHQRDKPALWRIERASPGSRIPRWRIFHRRHGELSLDCPLRAPEPAPRGLPSSQALVRNDPRPARRRARLRACKDHQHPAHRERGVAQHPFRPGCGGRAVTRGSKREQSVLELYHIINSVSAQKVRMPLHEKGLEAKEHLMTLAGDQFDPAYLGLNPNAAVPTLVHNGYPVVESSVILYHLDEAFPEPPLMPRDPTLRAKVRLYTKLITEYVHPAP